MWKYLNLIRHSNKYISLYSRSGEYKNLGLKLPEQSNWIKYFKYINDYDWLFIPNEVGGNDVGSLYPIGDYYWMPNTNEANGRVAYGGHASSGDYAGPFYYACDINSSLNSYTTGARLMFIPDTIASNYATNISKHSNIEDVEWDYYESTPK